MTASFAFADSATPGVWGDQGDGTYANPILPGDYSDLDAIRVGDDYYAISSTLHLSPGMVVLHSKDLVNWNITGHAVDDVSRIDPELNWDRMGHYGRGVWAGAIRYHAGKFWIFFGTPDEGFFMTSATNPAGPWEPLHQLWKVKGWDDCCPFWDDDGQAWFVCTNFSDNYKIHLFKMTADGRALLPDSDRVIHQSKGSEANKLYKIDRVYYHLFSEVKAEGRVVMMNRAKSLEGPWETRQLNHVDQAVDREPNQGGLIQVPSGSWWFLTHQGSGRWDGRTMCLLPVTWIDGWPIIGKPGTDGIGNMVWREKKPIEGFPIVVPNSSDDDFGSSNLSAQWEWNHQPRKDKWSLSERPGFLRLHAFKPLKNDDLKTAGNTLSQRSMGTSGNVVTVKLDLTGMADGQVAGLCHFSKEYSTIGVRKEAGATTIESVQGGKVTRALAVTATKLWLQSSWGLDGKSHYAYSTDGTDFTQFGDVYQLGWGDYRGDRVGIFTYNNDSEAGYIDVDSFAYHYDSPMGTDNSPFGHPLIPDMVADPSIVDMGGTFYCYATTDGWGQGLETSGTPVVWQSKDFLNWSFDGSSFPPDFDLKYWAPSTVVYRNGRYYSFPTLDGKITAVVADSPTGLFLAPDGQHITKAHWQPYPIEQKSAIDAEVFTDDDGQAYMVWSRRRMAKLKPDLLSTDGPTITIPTKRQGYSEGPFLTKRKGIYYFFYTLGGDEKYQYAYMMNRTSPLGPWEAPEQDIIATTDHEQKIFGPGHGCFFHPQDSDQWYFVYLEYSRGSTNRQIYANKMNFNEDGTIQPIQLTKAGVGALRPVTDASPNLALGGRASASSTRPNYHVPARQDHALDRTETFEPINAIDDSNGTRWLAATGDTAPWWQIDLGAPRDIHRTEAYFVKPAAGQAYRLEWSLDGQSWHPYGGHDDVICRSPHRDEKSVQARYLKLTILKGEPGLWELRVY